jgi:hypothetical protein
MKNSLASRVLAVAVAALSSGCSLVLQGGGLGFGSGSAASTQRAASYDGDECERVLYDLSKHDHNDYNHDERKFPQYDDPKPASQMLLVSCVRRQKRGVYGHTIEQWPKIKDLNVEKVYYDLDDRKLDSVTMAVTAIQIMDADFEQHPRYNEKKWRGLAAFYGEIINRKTLASRVAKAGLSEEANQAFLALYDDAIARAKGTQFEEGERAVFIDIPVATYKARKAHFKEFAELYKKLDELTAEAKAARKDPAVGLDIVEKLSALRGDFLAKCGKPECRSQLLWAHATRELALMHVAREAALDAIVESRMNMSPGSYTAGFAQAIHVAQELYVKKMEEAYRKYKKAKDSGVDDETALSIAGGSRGFDFRHGDLFNPKTSLPNYAEALDQKGQHSYPRDTAVAVASVQPSGPKARIVFEKDTFQSDEPYNCRQTGRLQRIRSDGTLEYEEICSYRPRTQVVEKHPPVVVLAAEAKHIRRGDVVRFISKGEEARVIEVKRGDKVIQIRGDLVGGGGASEKK